ncbi:MAG: hypothetical protein M3P14_00555 [Chloroflexota bacterium]|nr:hypothetical protein [Chloroflexota bacterium]
MSEKKRPRPGSTVGNRGEASGDTIPDRQPGDERVSANDTQSSGAGKSSDRVQGREDDWPHGHRFGGARPREEGMEGPH